MGYRLRYDAAIIGAGAEGLAAATLLGQAGLRVLVIEHAERAGGRCALREFHPGFRASPFADEADEIPAELYWTLDLARRGAIFSPCAPSRAQWSDRRHIITSNDRDAESLTRFLAEIARRRRSIVARCLSDAKKIPSRSWLRRVRPEPWPASDWTTKSLDEILSAQGIRDDAAAHLASCALAGNVADPSLSGSAVRLLAANASGGRSPGGLARLADALVSTAQNTGVEFRFGLEATDIQRKNGRVAGVGLADGTEIATRSVISTLDLKRTFLTLLPWNALPKPTVQRLGAFRMAGARARVLFALDDVGPLSAADTRLGPIHVLPELTRMSETFQSWRAGVLAENLPAVLNVVSAGDPVLAPRGSAVVTATLGAVPFRLFDGAWTYEKRELLRKRALAAAESAFPGFSERVVAAEVITPPDFEEALGATEGDPYGGEIAGDQMLGQTPFGDVAMPRTPISGLYAAGSYLTAGAFATCAAGAAAAYALLADIARGHLK